MRAIVRLILGALVVAVAAPATAQAVIPAPPSTWFALPGLSADAGAANVRSLAHSAAPNPTTLYAGIENGGVFRSSDGGANWAAFSAGLPSPRPTVSAVLSSPDGATAWAGTAAGVWRSAGGGPWAQLPLNHPVTALASPSGSPNTVYAGTDLGVYASTDGGSSWSPSSIGSRIPAGNVVNGLSITGEKIYAATTAGVYVSADSAFTWTRKSDGIPQAAVPNRVVAYPEHPDLLFAATSGEYGVYRSTNAGTTWAPMDTGLPGAQAFASIQLVSDPLGASLYLAYRGGVLQTLVRPSAAAPLPEWRHILNNGPGPANPSVGALTAPVIPTAGGAGVVIGTASGGFVMGLAPVDSACSSSNPMPGDSDCPTISDQTPVAGERLTTTTGDWTPGTRTRNFTYQWQGCTGTNVNTECQNITDATTSELIVSKANGAAGLRFRAIVTAHNPYPSFTPITRSSVLTGVATAAPGSPQTNYPGAVKSSSGSVDVFPPGTAEEPKVGDIVKPKRGIDPMTMLPATDWFSPAADEITQQWLRCDAEGDHCLRIADASFSPQYVLAPADGGHTVRVIVRGKNAKGLQEVRSAASAVITSVPAAVDDRFFMGGTLPGPSIGGTPETGAVLTGFVGGWQDPTTDFRKTWLRCDATGNGCAPIPRAGGVEDGSSYVVTAADLGSTIRFRVLADVNGDLTPDGVDSFAPAAVTVDSWPTAPIQKAALPGGGEPGGGSGTPDTTAPTISKLRLTKKSFRAGKTTNFKFTLSEAATLSIVVTKPVTGRKVAKVCQPLTKKNRTKKKCTFQKVVTTLAPFDAPAGDASRAFQGLYGKTGKKKLPVGAYTATITATDASGNVSKPQSVKFQIKRR